MSPECTWSEVPRSVKSNVKIHLEDGDLAQMLNSDSGFFITECSEVIEAAHLILEQLEVNIERAKKDPEFYHVISLRNSKRARNSRKAQKEISADAVLENANKKSGWGKHHRGKHRSETKGKGFLAWSRGPRYGNDRPSGIRGKK